MLIFHNDVLVVKEEGPDVTELGLGDELCSDSFPYKLYKGVWYKFTLQTRTDKDTGDYNTGANASQEEATEGTDASEQTGVNAVLNHRLEKNETMGSKKLLKEYIRKYYPALKKVVTKKHPDMPEDEVKERLQKYQEVLTEFVGDFDNCDFYTGENMNHLGTHLFIRWDGETPYGYLPIDGINEVKY